MLSHISLPAVAITAIYVASTMALPVTSEKRSLNEENTLEARFNFGNFIKSALPVVAKVVRRDVDEGLEARDTEQLEARHFSFGKFIHSVGDVAKTGLGIASKVARDVEDGIEAREVEYDIDQLD